MYYYLYNKGIIIIIGLMCIYIMHTSVLHQLYYKQKVIGITCQQKRFLPNKGKFKVEGEITNAHRKFNKKCSQSQNAHRKFIKNIRNHKCTS